MASTKLNSWGVALLLAATTVGCSSGTANQGGGSCPDPVTQRACPINGVAMCTNVLTDATNCGACGTVCSGATGLCSNGVCTGSCQSGQTQCGSSCTNTSNDINNCGSCNTKCNSGSSCVNGSCQTSSSSVGGQGNTTATSQGGNNPGNGGNSSSSTTNQGGSSTSSNTSQGGNTSTTSSGQGGATSAGGSSAKGGASTGGSSTSTSAGGTSSSSVGGSSAKGGASSGGSGTTATGGTSTSSSATGGSGNTGSTPPGWWTAWKTEGWKGCAWTGVDSLANTTTTITPKDFTAKAASAPYAVKGTVMANPEYKAVALLGFNLNQDPSGASCTYDPALATAKGPPAVTFATSATGIAVNFAKTSAFKLRIQIQGVNGATDETDRWCQTITGANGKAFMPFNKFYPKCWNADDTDAATDPGTAYSGQPISAVVFAVPGETTAIPFDFTVIGFALGTKAEDAPDGTVNVSLEGDIGGAGATDLDFKRVKVSAEGEEYIIQNNNWGNPGSTNQTLHYKDNSFKITSPTGSGPGGGVPASFPSIYIGSNGNTEGGAMSTKTTDKLPMQVSTITSIQTTFNWTGSCGSGFNASYDVWFSQSIPSAEYKDAISGFVMVWLCDPSDAQPIGSVQRTATIGGKTWDVWVGPRGGSGSNSNAPVVSYAAKSGFNSFTFNLLDFIKDAATNGIQGSWYLTDVFAGFEIWNGGSTNGLAVDKFTCVVQ